APQRSPRRHRPPRRVREPARQAGAHQLHPHRARGRRRRPRVPERPPRGPAGPGAPAAGRGRRRGRPAVLGARSLRCRRRGVWCSGKRHFGPFGLQLGLRHDRNRIDVDDAVAIGPDRRFDTTSGSLSLEWEASEDLHLALGFDRAQRSPTAEELYSNGVHVATGSVEHGDPALDVETANRTELGAHWHLGPLTLRASVYRVAYDDFIYLAHTGTFDDELPVQQWRQADARFTGGEAELDWALADNASGHWDLRLFG